MEYNFIGKTLGGRYEILEVIGTGGMATVYKAQCHLLNRFVAIKILKSSLKDDEEVVKRFNTESRAAASLSHHNIVSIYDVGETSEGLSYIVMEYVEGVTLKEYIKQRGRLSWNEACEFAYQIARALECAHEHGIIHRDIKPHNILLAKDLTVKVADFGIARTTSSETVIAKGQGGVLGSVHYISPEQARGGYIDACADIYSLGIVLYEMLSGTVPFRGENPVSVALMKLENDPEDIREVADDIPEAVCDIVMKAIEREQHKRYQSAMELAFDLRETLDRGKTRIAPQVKKTGKKKKNTNKKIVVFALLLAVVLGIGSYYALSGGRQEYEVPNLMDLTLEEAIPVAKEAGFEIDEENITYIISEEYEEGRIMKQDPGANTFVGRKKKIKLVVSSGLEEGDIEVPNVVGLDYAEAASDLRAAKLRYQKVEEDNDEFEFNQVVRQSPKSGTKVTENYVVILHVSTGVGSKEESEPVEVPRLEGNTLKNAEDILKKAGFKKGNVSREASDMPEGTVILQSPKAGSESPKDSFIDLVVSSGKPKETEAPEKTQEPTQKPTQEPTKEPLKKKTLTIQLPQTDSGSVEVKVIANGTTIYNKTHQSSEGTIDIPVASKNDATVEVYFDGKLTTTKVIEF